MHSPTPDEAGWAAHRALCDAREPIVYFGFSRREDNGERFYEINGEPRFGTRGEFLGYRGVGRDVTTRKLAAEALGVSEERYALAMEASDEGHFDWVPKTDEVFVSERFKELLGLPPGSPSVRLRSEMLAGVAFHPGESERVSKITREVLAGAALHHEFEYRLSRGSGALHWNRVLFKIIRDKQGVAVRVVGTIMDVTERKLAAEALGVSEERYALAMEASESGYWDWDIPTGRYFVSPRAYELAGFPPGTKWVGRDDYRKHINMHPEDLARWEAAREALFAGTGERLSMEVRYMIKGEPRWHVLHAICKRDDAGKVIRWTGSDTDITERKVAEQGLEAMERKLRQAQRLEAMGTLAGGIAHDFNNILGAILGYGEMAQRDAPKDSRLARDLGSIIVAGERGRALVDRVLAFSRSAVGERVPVHVERVVRETLDLVSSKLPPSVTLHAKLHTQTA